MSTPEPEQRLTAKLHELSRIVDSLNKPIDPGILRTVALLQLHGFPTKASCEGHIAWGAPNPWVDIGTRLPKDIEQWQGETAVKARLMHDLGFTDADINPGKHHNHQKYMIFNTHLREWRDTTNPQLTEAYQHWLITEDLLHLRLTKLIRQFEGTREAEPLLVLENNRRLTLWDTFTKQDQFTNRQPNLSPTDQQALTNRLHQRQNHITAFTEFLTKQL